MATDWNQYQGVRPCAKAWKAAGIICERLAFVKDSQIKDDGHYLRLVQDQRIPDKVLKKLKIGFAQMIHVEVYGTKPKPKPKKKK